MEREICSYSRHGETAAPILNLDTRTRLMIDLKQWLFYFREEGAVRLGYFGLSKVMFS